MHAYRLCTLYSGSGGNAAYLETPTARILIDAGKSARTLVTALRSIGVEPDSLDAIFITHDHNDHCAYQQADHNGNQRCQQFLRAILLIKFQ